MIIKNLFKKTKSSSSPISYEDWESINPFAVEIINKLQDHNYEAYLVGGCVRDLLANIKPKDFDIATNAEPKEIRKIFKASRIIGKRFQLVHIYKGKQIIEVATFRAGLNKNSTTIENDLIKDDAGKIIRDNIWGNIEDDCNRRDFTTIITDGPNGSFIITDGEVIKSNGFEVEAIDTNGAGDMFAGAFMHAMLSGKELHECGAFANLAASKIVQTFGPRLKKEEYQDLLENL